MANKVALYISVAVVLGVVIFLGVMSKLNVINFSPQSFNVNVSVGNSPPIINWVNFSNIGAEIGGVANVTIDFSVIDGNGVNDLNDATARVEIYNLTFGVLRFNNSCNAVSSVGNTKNYTCVVGMWYFDHYGQYTVNVTIKDNANNVAENSSGIFSYSTTISFTVYPGSLLWPPVTIFSTDVNSSNDPLYANNSGNTPLNIVNLTAYDLPGAINSSEFIFAGNFSVNINDDCTGFILSNRTGVIIDGSNLSIGNLSLNDGSAQEQLYFCINGINPGTSSQSYSTSKNGGTSWNIDFR